MVQQKTKINVLLQEFLLLADISERIWSGLSGVHEGAVIDIFEETGSDDGARKDKKVEDADHDHGNQKQRDGPVNVEMDVGINVILE